MRREWPALAFAMLLPTALAGVYLILLADGGESGSGAVQGTYSASKLFQFSLPVLILWWCDRPALVWPSLSNRGVWLGIGFGLAVGALVFAVQLAFATTLLADLPARIGVRIRDFGIASPLRFLALAVFIALFHSLMEEYYYRWFIHGRLRQYLSFTPAIVLSSLAFTGHHLFVLHGFFPDRFWSATVPFSLCIAVGGAFWAWLYERTGSLLGPWISHLTVDVAVLLLGYRMVF